MNPLRVWFNKSFSSVFNVIRRLQATTVPHPFHVLCSHTNREFVGFEVAAESEVEPAGLSAADYVKYCLDFCERHAVQVFVPGRSRVELAEARDQFAARGVRMLVAAEPAHLHLFEDKGRFYRTLDPAIVAAPRFISVRNATEFADAVALLRSEGRQVCFKPSQSMGGLGFRILDDTRGDIRNLLGGEAIRLTTALATHILAQEPAFRELLVMEYLEGAEYSVDCLSARGRLLCAISRRKATSLGGTQLLEDRPDLHAISARLAETYGLDGIFNVQVRHTGGVPKLLEINARFSGGIYFACLSGVDLPAWALALAAGTATEADLPEPQYGLAVHQQYQEFVFTKPPSR